jgi:hypothetical protein
MALVGWTDALTPRNRPGGKGQPVSKAENLTAIGDRFFTKCGSLGVSQNLQASTTCYRDSYIYVLSKYNRECCKKFWGGRIFVILSQYTDHIESDASNNFFYCVLQRPKRRWVDNMKIDFRR